MLRKRVASALVGLALLALVLWLGGPWGWAVFVAIIAVLGLLEFYDMARHARAEPLAILGCLWTAVLILAQPATSHSAKWTAGSIGLGVVATLICLLARRRKQLSLPSFAWTLAGVFYVGWLSRYLVALRGFGDGREWVALALLTTFSVDTAAYFAGRAFGRHKLAPAVSPGKTKEGAVAGLAGAVLAAWALNVLLRLPMSTWQALSLGLIIGIFAQVGDLAESMFKRSAGVKDSGRLMPGHGGILDRIDSILLTGIVVYYYVIFIPLR